jgi:hypothetical protein
MVVSFTVIRWANPAIVDEPVARIVVVEVLAQVAEVIDMI